MLLGIDVSSYQPVIDWPTVARFGRQFAIIKATEGTSYVNPQFFTQIQQGQASGLLVACYHFFAWTDPAAEMSHFVRTVRQATVLTGVPLAVDFERGGYNPPANAATLFVGALEALEAMAGYPPVWYSSIGFVDAYDVEPPARNGQWIADWSTSAPSPVPPAPVWAIWQHATNQSVPGIENPVDVDFFDGDVAQFRAYGGR